MSASRTTCARFERTRECLPVRVGEHQHFAGRRMLRNDRDEAAPHRSARRRAVRFFRCSFWFVQERADFAGERRIRRNHGVTAMCGLSAPISEHAARFFNDRLQRSRIPDAMLDRTSLPHARLQPARDRNSRPRCAPCPASCARGPSRCRTLAPLDTLVTGRQHKRIAQVGRIGNERTPAVPPAALARSGVHGFYSAQGSGNAQHRFTIIFHGDQHTVERTPRTNERVPSIGSRIQRRDAPAAFRRTPHR